MEMMEKRKMCAGEDTGELRKSKRVREGHQGAHEQESVPPAACHSLMHIQL